MREAQLALESCLNVSADPTQHEDEDDEPDDGEPEIDDVDEPTQPEDSSREGMDGV